MIRRSVLSSLRALAQEQYHVVSRAQAHQLGLDRKQISALLATGEWQRATTRVLPLAGGRRSFAQQCMTVVLHTGGALCGESTLALCGVPGFPRRAPVRVVIRRGERVFPITDGVISQVRSLPDHHLMRINGVPSVTPTRAIYDLAARFHWEKVRRALKSTWRKKFTSGGLVHRMGPEWLGRGRPGTAAMRELLAVTPADYQVPDTNLEDRLFSIVEGAGFPPLKRQQNLGDDSRWIGRVDGKDPEFPLIAEVDSETFHFGPIDGDDDEARDKAFGEAGLTVVRFTESEVWHEPAGVVARWRAARANCQTNRP